jgi:lysophospholipase L1-like esterase
MKLIKIIFYNLFFLIAIIGFLIFLLVILSESIRYTKNNFFLEKKNECIRSSCMLNYENFNWAKKHFLEYKKIRFHYETPIIFRADKFSGDTINIEGIYNTRKTESENKIINSSRQAYFFGGSVMWGFGSSDKHTIPSYFQNFSGIKSFNFGESAWTSDQSLMYLIRLLKDGHKPDYVIFYHGANDYDKCLQTGNHYGLLIEDKLQKKFKESMRSFSKTTFKNFFSIPLEIIEKVRRVDPVNKEVNLYEYIETTKCNNKELQKKIALNLTQNWEIAHQLVTNYGGKFYAFLEPHAFFTNTKLDQQSILISEMLRFKEVKLESFTNVYKFIEEEMEYKKYFNNFKAIFNNIDDFVFIDSVHTSPNGNKFSAKKIYETIDIN